MGKPTKKLSEIEAMVLARLRGLQNGGTVESVSLFFPPSESGEVAVNVQSNYGGQDVGAMAAEAMLYARQLCREYEVEAD